MFLEILQKCLRIILKIKKKISEDFENYQGEFREVFHKNFLNISENSAKYIGKFRKSLQKISEDFEKYFGNLREVFQKISKNTS